MATVKITQVRSAIGRPKNQVATLKALGLGRIGKSVEKNLTPQIQGMVNKLSHLLEVKES